jgi:triacylglycerol esterase/lipase EstA (alpha/beta hydrolase family)
MRTTFRRAALVGALAVVALVGGALAVGVPDASAAPASGGRGGFDDYGCRPSPEHPSPVVLLHGLGGNGPGNLGALGLRLAGEGYCAFELTYGKPFGDVPVGGLVDVHRSAREIAAFIERVRGETGARKVNIVGHSEGGFQSLFVPKTQGIADRIDTVVALAPPTHGTTFGGLVSVADTLEQRRLVDQVLKTYGCPACAQLIRGGAGVRELDQGPIAQRGVSYTIIASRTDLLVTPHDDPLLGTTETAFIREPGVHNVYVQDRRPYDPVGHIGLAYDANVHQLVLNALDPDHARPLPLGVGLPL